MEAMIHVRWSDATLTFLVKKSHWWLLGWYTPSSWRYGSQWKHRADLNRYRGFQGNVSPSGVARNVTKASVGVDECGSLLFFFSM